MDILKDKQFRMFTTRYYPNIICCIINLIRNGINTNFEGRHWKNYMANRIEHTGLCWNCGKLLVYLCYVKNDVKKMSNKHYANSACDCGQPSVVYRITS